MMTPDAVEIEVWPASHPALETLDLDMPFRPSMDAIAYYVATGDWVMLYNAVTLAVTPTYSE